MNERSQQAAANSKVPDLTEKLAPVLDKLGLSLMRSQARLNARLGEPMTTRAETESVKLFLPRQKLEHSVENEVVNSGRIQVMATYTPGQKRWQWITPFDGIPSVSTDAFLGRIASHDLLKELHTFPAFRIDESVAPRFASWVARECDFQGAYAVPTDAGKKGSQWAFLAIDLSSYAADGLYEVEANPWCSCCGALPHEVRAYVKAEADTMICESCTDDFANVLNESDRETLENLERTWNEPSRHAPHCLFCGDKTPRMFAGTFSICIPCLQNCQRSLQSSSHN